MTTAIIIQPAGHRVRVTSVERSADGTSRTTEETLDAGSPSRTLYIHSARDLLIAEDNGQPPVPTVTGESFEQDLISLEAEHENHRGGALDELISGYELRLAALREREEYGDDADHEGLSGSGDED